MREKKKKGRIGRPPKHGGYSLITRKEISKNRRYIANYLTDIREGLIEDIAGEEEDLSAAQKILIDRVITKLSIIRLIEEHVKENGIFNKGKLDSSLGLFYLRIDNSIKLQLQALGIERKKKEKILSPFELAKVIEAESERESQKKEKKKGKKEIRPYESSIERRSDQSEG